MLDTTTIRPLTVTADSLTATADSQAENGPLQFDSDARAQSITGSDCSYPSTRSRPSADDLGQAPHWANRFRHPRGQKLRNDRVVRACDSDLKLGRKQSARSLHVTPVHRDRGERERSEEPLCEI